MRQTVEALRRRKPRLVVGTPGRLAQLSRDGKLGLHGVHTVVLDEADVDRLRAAFDAAVAEDLPLTMGIKDRETLIAEVGEERSNVDMIPASVQQMRIIRIGDQVDVCPCAGTHVRSLGEIGPLGDVHVKSKGKGTKRFAYTLDGNLL